MKLQHTLGGLEGLGPVDFQKRVFVAPWEKHIFGIHVAMMGLSAHLREAVPPYPLDDVPSHFHDTWTWADLRRGAEAMHPFDYFKLRYYEKWLGGISSFFVEKGYITQEELAAKTAFYLQAGNLDDGPLPQRACPAIDEQIIAYLRSGDSPRREVQSQPKFALGETVLVANAPVAEHTRLPGYLRSKQGVIEHVYAGAYAYFPGPVDGIGPAMPVYCVRFDPRHLWGEASAEPGCGLYADLFEAYLTPVAAPRP